MSHRPIHFQNQTFARQSFVILPRFLEPQVGAALRRACDATLEWSRANYVETGHTSPRISLLPQAGSFEAGAALLRPIVEFAASAPVCAMLGALSSADAVGAPQLKDAHYYHEPTKRDWDGDWHRDTQFSRIDPDAERELVTGSWSVHFRVAFEADDRLEIVPGSHCRWDTDEELRIRRGGNRATADMPNALRISLQPGDACVFHAWSIHRASYRRTPSRRTLDLLYASTHSPPAGFR